MNPMPFYLDWKFWSAVIAFTALVLSQLPPLQELFRKARLSCEAFSRIHITHKIGNPNAQWHLIIENTGGRSLRIKEVNLTFQKAGGAAFVLPAQSYFRTPESTDSVMFTPFRLAVGEEWAHVITFFKLFSRDDEKEYRRLESDIRSEILVQKENPENKDKVCEANSETIRVLINFFKRHYKWEAGEYDLSLNVLTDNEKANINRQFRFSLFESESQELAAYSDTYKFGAGVFWVASSQEGLSLPVHEK